jgi:hypothetical protein
MLETCSGPEFLINSIKRVSHWFHYTDVSKNVDSYPHNQAGRGHDTAEAENATVPPLPHTSLSYAATLPFLFKIQDKHPTSFNITTCNTCS